MKKLTKQKKTRKWIINEKVYLSRSFSYSLPLIGFIIGKKFEHKNTNITYPHGRNSVH